MTVDEGPEAAGETKSKTGAHRNSGAFCRLVDLFMICDTFKTWMASKPFQRFYTNNAEPHANSASDVLRHINES